ncbi:MAG: hypothetical protein J6C23_08135 [Clostridia bacterium]|nr:hypothetical protein [Clostridia bacterium]
MRSKSKSKIIFAIITIIVCTILLASTSLALFTDTAEETTVRIQSGTMQVDLQQADSNGHYVSLENKPGNIFGNDGWEPNQTRVYFFKVVNNSNIIVKFTFVLIADMMDMAGSLEYSSFEDQQFEDVKGSHSKYYNASYDNLYENRNPISGPTYVQMQPGEEKYYAVAVRMKWQSGNEYQGKYCSIDVFLHAMQGNATP